MRASSVGIAVLGALGIYIGFFVGAWGLVPGVAALLWLAAVWLSETRRAAGGAWFLPFLWILVVPAVTMSAQIALLGLITDGYQYGGVFAGGEAGACDQVAQLDYDKQWSCPAAVALPTLLPGLLNLVPLIGLLSAVPIVRAAAAMAGGLGLVRLLVPLALYAADGADVTIIGSWQFPPAMGSFASAYASMALWVLSVAVTVAFAGWRIFAARGAASPGPGPARGRSP